MRYLSHTPEDIKEMLKVAGRNSLEELFAKIPEDCLRKEDLVLPEPLTEWELDNHLEALARKNSDSASVNSFLGAGSYDHYRPAALSYLLQRSELTTAYTPYQPEMSQGTLQAMFEYQTLISALLGMEVSNASMYDGASALVEALFMALRISRKKNKVAVSRLIHPGYRDVIRTYFGPTPFEMIELPYLEDGSTDISALEGYEDLAAVAVQSPNFFGCLEDLAAFKETAAGKEALLIVSFTEPLAYGLFKNPGSQGADIVAGEGQSLGIPQSFGGPGLGVFCTHKKYIRKMPGRLVGRTTDKYGETGYVLTLATREQHIRREKATSNICSNQGLCATMAAMYLAFAGGSGLQELAALNRDKCEYLKREIEKAGFFIPFSRPGFNEFVVDFSPDFGQRYIGLLEAGIIPGLDLGTFYPELADHYLLSVTETKSRSDMDALVKEVSL